MADTDLIARVYPFGDGSETQVKQAFSTSSYFVAPRIQLTEPQTDSARRERGTTQPPPEGFIDYSLPCIELRFSKIPRSHYGVVFGVDPNSDVVLPDHGSLSYHHFSLTFDEANRLIIKDWGATNGTEVTYDDQGRGARKEFQWIVGGDPVLEDISDIIIALPTQPKIKLKIIVAQYDIESKEYIDRVDRFRQGSATAEDLFADLNIPKRQDTRRPTGAHTTGTGNIYLTKVLGEGSFAVVSRFWNVSTGEKHALKEPSRKAIRDGQFKVENWKNENHIMRRTSHVRIPVSLFTKFI